MNDLVGALQRHVRLVATVAGVLVVLAAWWLAWMQPQGRKITAEQSQLQSVQASVIQTESRLATLKADKRDVDAAEPFFKRFAEAVPPTPEQAQLVSEIYYLSQRTGVTPPSITPSYALNASTLGYSEVYVTLSAQGTLAQIENFVAGLTGEGSHPLACLLTIQALSFAGSSQANVLTDLSGQYSVSISAIAYTTDIPAGSLPGSAA